MAELSKRDRMRMGRTPVPLRDPAERVDDFDEVSFGYASGMAVLEASRCLNCTRQVCVDGCPVGIRIGEFIQLVADGDFSGAAEVIHEDNVLPSVCGRVCPQEAQCEGACVLARKGRPIAIGYLERFVADEERKNRITRGPIALPAPTGKSVAVIGSGPAGLSCAADLVKVGHQVVVYEALHELGGVLAYGIPSFRLPKDIVRAEIGELEELGVVFETDVIIGPGMTVHDLLATEGFDAVFIGTGAGLPRFPGISGEELIGVYSANEFLTRVNLMAAYDPNTRTPVYDLVDRTAVVIGGGNTAIDAARTALRLGAKRVTVLYRRSETELPARREEVEHAREEGVQMRFLVSPTAFVGEGGWLRSVTIQRMKLGETDDTGRSRPEPVPDTEEDIRADVAIVAIGNAPNPVLTRATPALDTSSRGTINVDPVTGETSVPGVFAGGDITTGGATVIRALGAGRRAAQGIDRFLCIEGC